MSNIELTVPDIGDATDVDVIEVLISVGDTIEKEQSLITLESDKASMEIPAAAAGVVKEILVKVGDKVSEGAPIVLLEAAADSAASADADPARSNKAPRDTATTDADSSGSSSDATSAASAESGPDRSTANASAAAVVPAPASYSGKAELERSEEHTSELQSRGRRVCRLVLVIKKGRYRRWT